MYSEETKNKFRRLFYDIMSGAPEEIQMVYNFDLDWDENGNPIVDDNIIQHLPSNLQVKYYDLLKQLQMGILGASS